MKLETFPSHLHHRSWMRWHDTCTRVSTVSVVSVSCLSRYREGHEIKGQKGTGGRRMGYGVQEVGGCDQPTKDEKEHTGSSNVMSTWSYWRYGKHSLALVLQQNCLRPRPQFSVTSWYGHLSNMDTSILRIENITTKFSYIFLKKKIL